MNINLVGLDEEKNIFQLFKPVEKLKTPINFLRTAHMTCDKKMGF